jgi:hypothetical protein
MEKKKYPNWKEKKKKKKKKKKIVFKEHDDILSI